MIARLALALLLVGCGAATASVQRESESERESEGPGEGGGESESSASSWIVGGVDLGADVATIDLDVPVAGDGVHACLFVLQARRFSGWACSVDRSHPWIALDPGTADALARALPTADAWGTPLADDRAPAAFTLHAGRQGGARFADAPGLHAFRDALLAAAQDGLARFRALPEDCSGCRDGEYCRQEYQCYTMGPDGKRDGDKSCAVEPSCHTRLPPTSVCEQDHQCRSLHCDGRDAVQGACR